MSTYKAIAKNGKEIGTPASLHPGEVLAEELEARGLSQKSFAELVGMRPSHFNELLKGKRNLSAILALKLEEHLEIDAAFWMRLQIDYDLKKARRQLELA